MLLAIFGKKRGSGFSKLKRADSPILTLRSTRKLTPPLWYKWGGGGWTPPWVFIIISHIKIIFWLVGSPQLSLQYEVFLYVMTSHDVITPAIFDLPIR